MKTNMGTTDRVVRVIVAAVLAALYVSGSIEGVLGIAALIVAFIFVITSLVSFCPLYLLVGITTCKSNSAA